MANAEEGIDAISSMILKMKEEELRDLAKRVPMASRKIGVFVPVDVASVLTAIKIMVPQVTVSSLIVGLMKKSIKNSPGLLRLYKILQETREQQKEL